MIFFMVFLAPKERHETVGDDVKGYGDAHIGVVKGVDGSEIILASQYYIKGCAVIVQLLLVIPLFIIVRYTHLHLLKLLNIYIYILMREPLLLSGQIKMSGFHPTVL